MTTVEERQNRNWGMLCHLSALAGYVIPLGNVFGPLLVWLVRREESALVDEQGKESLNFELSVTLYVFVGIILMLTIIGIFVGLAVIFLAALAQIVFVVIASVKVSNGEPFQYPLTIRFIK